MNAPILPPLPLRAPSAGSAGSASGSRDGVRTGGGAPDHDHDLLGSDDPYPDDDRPSRRRPTISGRPFEPWLVAGDRLPPPGGYHFDPAEARPTQDRARHDRDPSDLPSRRGPGRPRNVDAERKAFAAVLELFGQRGWAGLSLDSVAAEAGLGKSSIYLRWADKQALLIDALTHLDVSVLAPVGEDEPRPGIREMLIHAANRRVEQYGGENGPALYRLNIEARIYPEVFEEIWQQTIGRSIRDLTRTLLDNVEGEYQPTEEDAMDLIASVEGTALYLAFLASPTATPNRRMLHERIARTVDRHLRSIREHIARRATGQDQADRE